MVSVRRRVAALVAALVALGAVVTVTASADVGPTAAPVRIMPLGDSITAGPGCWRAYLWERLRANGYSDIDFVGNQAGGGCTTNPWDGDHEGHGGIAAIGMANANQLPPWLATTNPDVVLMHLGTNDIWAHPPTADILAAYGKLVDQMRANNPDMKIILAQIIPMAPPQCATCASDAVALNNAIPAWAAAKSTTRSPIVVVDQWTGFDPVADTNGDGVHPDDSGFRKMSDRWYPALARFLTPGTVPTTTSAPGGACTATVSVNGWTGGFVATVRVTAGAAGITRWTATVDLPAGAVVTNTWNASAGGTTGSVPFSDVGYNGRLGPGQSAEFGFQGTGSAAGATATCAA